MIPPNSNLHIGLELVDGLYDPGDPPPNLHGAGGMTIGAGDRRGFEIAGWQTNSNTHGTMNWSSDHTQLVYTPASGYAGGASFTYTISYNGVPVAQAATVAINVNNPVSVGPTFVNDGTVDVQLPATGSGNLTVLATLPFTVAGGTVTATWVETPETWTSHFDSMARIQRNLKADVVGNTVRIGVTDGAAVNVNYLDGAVFRIKIQNGDGSDTVLVHFYNPALHTAPTFYPLSYIFYVSSATQNGDTIGKITATDRDSLQISYSFGVDLNPYITVDSTGVVKVTNAAGLRMNMQSANQFSFDGTAIAINSALLAGNASVTIKLRSDPLDMDTVIQQYITAWYDATINNARNTNEIAKLVIGANINAIVAGWENFRANFNDSTNVIWAVSGFTPIKYASPIGTAAVLAQIIANRFYINPGLANVATMKSTLEADCTAVLLSTANQILAHKTSRLGEWSNAKAVIDGNMTLTPAERARLYGAYLVNLQNTLLIPPPLTYTSGELWDLIN